ncbi:MAG: hypothetical protein ACTH56_04320 [Pseudoalteromonas sp.]
MQTNLLSTDTLAQPRILSPKIKNKLLSHSYKYKVVLRFIAAIVGGYVFTSCFICLLALVLPLSKLDAVLISTTISVFVYTCVFIWSFTVKSLARIWITILLTTGLTTLALTLIESGL